MKFVIHHHLAAEEHYDFMLEREDSLETWRIAAADFTLFTGGRTVPAEKIADHRKFYLDYEGPVSCDRGVVELVESGTYIIASENRFTLNGNVLSGELEIINNNTHGNFIFRFTAYSRQP